MREIVVYSTDADVPANLRSVAYFKDGNGYLPIRFNGATEDAVRATASAWWAEEAERQAKLRGGVKQPSVKPAEPRKVFTKTEIAAAVAEHGHDEFEGLL